MRTYYANSRPNEAFKIAQPLPAFTTEVLANYENLDWAAPVARPLNARSMTSELPGRSRFNQPAMAEACAR